ncbi:MAG TPA: MSMEG_4193 family putative phosphomutase [Anaerolineae bacterium]|nr:MSMEG_4193 family putative phosphomutase [Anaerolineae bacterium]
MAEIMNLLLIRHAANDWVGKKLAGWTPGVHLNEEGRAQAAALAERLAGVPLAAIYSSPLERACETAEPLAAGHGLDIQVREALGETGFGDWVGRELEELRKEKLWPVIQVYPGGARFPGGESMREVQARVVAELDAIRDRHQGETVAAVFHADPIKLAIAHYLGLPLDLFQRIEISPASITAFHFTRFGPQLVVLNSTPDLPDLEIKEVKEETEQLESEE